MTSHRVARQEWRRILSLLLAWCTGCAASRPVVGNSSFDHAVLSQEVGAIAATVYPGSLGVAVRDLATGYTWSINGGRAFPMQSVFKLPLGAVVLSAVDAGRLRLADTVVLTPRDLSPPYSPIASRYPGRTTYTVGELLAAAAGGSDNTAADVLMAMVGGPAAVTRWLMEKGVKRLRVDRYEREFQIELNALPPFRPEWAAESTFFAAVRAVPEERRRQAAAAYLVDPRDTSTPIASVIFLEKLARRELLSDSSTRLLLRIATETTTGAGRIKAALPDDASVAHKTGTAGEVFGMIPAVNDIGVITMQDGRRIALAVYLAGSRLSYASADSVHAAVTASVVRNLRTPR